MVRPGGPSTKERAAHMARRIIARDGLGALTLDAVASEVGVTKQAILHHYGSRVGLLGEVYLRELAQESATLVEAMQQASDPRSAVEAFVRAGIAWHLEDLDRFRLIYAANQMASSPATLDEETMQERVYPVTGRIYGTLEQALRGIDLPEGVDPRRLAVAFHMLCLGIACYAGTLEASGERFLHAWEDIGEAFVRAVVRTDA